MSILATTDFSENSYAAVKMAARQAFMQDRELILLHCLESAVDDSPWRNLLDDSNESRKRFWEAARTRLRELFEELVPEHQRPPSLDLRVEMEYPEEGIAKVLGNSDIDLVVVGATGQGRLASFFLGSTAEDVARMSPAPVLVVPADAEIGPFECIVAPVDFTACSRQSLERAVDLARADGAELIIVHGYVLPVTETTFLPAQMPPETIEAFEDQKQRQLDNFVAATDLEGVDYTEVLEVGSPHNVIVDTVEDHDADLVVMGTHGRRGVQRFFLGSNAVKVLRRMPSAVMTVRTLDDTGDDAQPSES